MRPKAARSGQIRPRNARPADAGRRRRAPRQPFAGNIFFGSEGFLTLDTAGFRVYKGEKRELTMEEKSGGGEDSVHMANFLAACRSRNHQELTADIEIGVTSVALAHFANIRYRAGRRLTIDPANWGIVNDSEASRMLTRDYRAPYVVPEKV